MCTAGGQLIHDSCGKAVSRPRKPHRLSVSIHALIAGFVERLHHRQPIGISVADQHDLAVWVVHHGGEVDLLDWDRHPGGHDQPEGKSPLVSGHADTYPFFEHLTDRRSDLRPLKIIRKELRVVHCRQTYTPGRRRSAPGSPVALPKMNGLRLCRSGSKSS